MRAISSKLSAYIDLLKPRIVCMVLITTAIGFFMAQGSLQPLSLLALTLLGTGLTCSGAGVLNHYLERDVDCKMRRTARRPIPAGIIAPGDALGLGIVLVLLGTALLAWKVNLLTGFLALLTAFLYVLVYTPLKRITWLNTLVGAIPGALPPMGGWTAVTGTADLGAWILFAILFVWQHPHFYAIAWMYRDDYRRGGFKMLPVIDDDRGTRTFRQIVFFSVLLVPVSLLPALCGILGPLYFCGALISSLIMLYVGVVLMSARSVIGARRLLRASVIYLPCLFTFIAVDILLRG